MEDKNLLKKFKKQKENISKDSDTFTIENIKEEKERTPEEILENLEPLLAEVEQISSGIEEKGDEIEEKNGNNSLKQKNQLILNELYEKSETFLRQISRQLANYPKGVVDSYRDKYIGVKAQNIRNRFYKNEAIKNFIKLKESNKEIDKNFFNVREKAEYAFNSIYKSSASFFKKIENSDWGDSKNKNDAAREVNYLLENIAKNSISLETYDEVFDVIKIYENSPSLMFRETSDNNFISIVNFASDHFYEKEKLTTKKEISELCREDPYLIIKYLDNKNYYLGQKKDEDFQEEQLDKIIGQYPANSCCNWLINSNFKKSLKSNPEKYGMDPQNREFIFESFKSYSIENDKRFLEENSYFFKKELDNLEAEEVENMIESYSSHHIKETSSQLFLSNLNLKEKDFEKIFNKFESSYYEGERKIYSKEELLEYFKKNNNLFVPLFKYKQFNLSPETRVEFFKKILGACSSDEIFIFFNQVLSNFNDIFNGIPEDKFEEIFQELIEKSIRGDIEKIRILHALLPEYDIPPRYREQINQVFSKEYSERTTDSVDKLFGHTRDNNSGEVIKFSKDEEWLLKNAEIAPKLEIAFYEKGNMNELRHFFFQVLEGEKASVDKDLLIKKYAERINDFGPEEFIDLFIVRKKIPMSYSNIFIEKILYNDISLFSQLDDCLRLGQISQGEYRETLLNFVNVGKYNFADRSLDICLEKKIIKESEREALFGYFINNVVKQASSNNQINSNTLQEIMKPKLSSANIQEDEKKFLVNDLFKELLKYDKLHNKILEIIDNDNNFFKVGFTNKQETENLVEKLLVSNNSKTISELLRKSLCYSSSSKEDDVDPIPFLIKGNFNTLFEHGLSLDNLEVNTILVNYFEHLDQSKKEVLLKYILSKEDILTQYNNYDEVKGFCSVLANTIQNDKEKLNQEERIISDENAKDIFTKIFSSSVINDDIFSELINYRKNFLLGNKDIMNQYALGVKTKGSYDNCFIALKEFVSSGKALLSKELVVDLSIRVLDNKNIDNRIYQMYLDSKPDNLCFYLDQEKFDKNIKKMSGGIRDIDISRTIDFIALQRNEQNKNELLEGVDETIARRIVLSKEQEEALGNKLLSSDVTASNFEEFYNLDQELFRKSLENTLNLNKLNDKALRKILDTKEEISGSLFSKIINYYFDPKKSKALYIFDSICDRYGHDPLLLEEIKGKVNNLPNIENRSVFKSKLLQKDLLSQDELKVFYDEIRSEPNIQSQVLLSAEVLGSLVHSNKLENRSKFFEAESEETKNNIEFISSFVKKYSLESKGRTIAVMLFSKEYLPERNMSEVIEKVASTLSKYERILDQYTYKGIPEGLNASIGLEYEITGSTAFGYKEVTERELKSDIVRLSNAAHIGNGRDAVHEIATRPATNPYLLLLEMQVLDYLKYIDLNFDYSPSYQKGARGYHLTIGGEKGLYVNANTNFLQNSILAASWGGIHAGETGKRVAGGRGVTLRGRSADGGNNNIKIFDKATDSVELRSLSVDKMEPFQRAIITAYHGAIAIQALEKFTSCTSDIISDFYKSNDVVNSEKDFINKLRENQKLKDGYENNEKYGKIIYAWAELTSGVKDALEYHNSEFLKGETTGYLDRNGVWVDSSDFGGSYNTNRFDSVVSSIDSTLSVEEYVNSTKISFNEFFSSFDIEFADNLTKINNLYLKPGNKTTTGESTEKISLGGDQANAISMLEVTRFDNENVEYRTDSSYLRGTVFDTLGERREGYYYVQGGSEKMITHACQIALLNFNKRMEEILKN